MPKCTRDDSEYTNPSGQTVALRAPARKREGGHALADPGDWYILSAMHACHFCGTAIENPREVYRSSTCSSCGKDLKICLNCRFYSPGAHWDCSESIDEMVRDKDRANFCTFFSFRAVDTRPEGRGVARMPAGRQSGKSTSSSEMTPEPVAFLDSGVGGLPYLARARRASPRQAPRLRRGPGKLPLRRKVPRRDHRRSALASPQRLIDREHPRLVVVACNTMSVVALADLRARFPVPFVGVVPGGEAGRCPVPAQARGGAGDAPDGGGRVPEELDRAARLRAARW